MIGQVWDSSISASYTAGAAIKDARVRTYNGLQFLRETWTNSAGSYSLDHQVGQGFTVKITKSSFQDYSKDFDIPATTPPVVRSAAMIPIDTQPAANFTGSPTIGTAPLTVTCTNSTTGGDAPLTYAWDFDNNGSTDSTAQNPSNIYNNGTHTVKLTVTDDDGDADTLIRTNYITVCYSNANIVGSSNTYASLQSAYNAAPDTNTIQARDVTINESVDMNQDITVTIQGGYNCDHSAVTGMTTINGNITISNGTATIGDVKAQ